MSIEPADRISAIILAAGESRRMGRPKAICQWGNVTFLESVVFYCRNAGIEKIGMVLGAWEQEIREHGLPKDVDVWSNPDYRHGQLSSLQVGLRHQDQRVLGTIVALVDHPAVKPETVRALVESFGGSAERVVKPTYRGRSGHPILIGREWWAEILDVTFPSADGQKPTSPTLRDIFARYPDRTFTFEVNDPGIHLDIDTPEILSRNSL